MRLELKVNENTLVAKSGAVYRLKDLEEEEYFLWAVMWFDVAGACLSISFHKNYKHARVFAEDQKYEFRFLLKLASVSSCLYDKVQDEDYLVTSLKTLEEAKTYVC